MPGTRHVILAIGALIFVYCAQQLDIVLIGKFAPVVADHLRQPLPALALVFMANQSGLAIGALMGGAAGDRWGRKPVVTACLAVAAVMPFIVPQVRSLLLLALLRGCSGLMLGAAAPCVLAMVASIAAQRWRPLAVTCTLAGASLGSALGYSIAFGFGTAQGWRTGSWICGGGLCAALFLFLLLVPDTRSSSATRTDRPEGRLLGRWRMPTLVLGSAFAFSLGMNILLGSWMPSFFHALAGVDIREFAAVAMFATPAAIIGMVGTGWISRRLSISALVALCFGGYSMALASLGTLGFGSRAFAVALAVTSCGQAACQAVLNIAVVARFPDALRGSALGVAAAAGRTGGILLPGIGALALAARIPIQPLFLLLAMVPLSVGTMVFLLEKLHPTAAEA